MTRRNIVRPIFICIRFQLTRDGGLGLEAIFMVQDNPLDATGSGLRYTRGELVNDLFLQDLRITAVARPGVGEGKPVLQDVAYRRKLPVDLQVATVMTNTLRRIEKGLRASRDADGWIDDFTAFVFRVAKATGASVVEIVESSHTQANPTFREMDPESLSAQIQRWQVGPGPDCKEEGGPNGCTR